MADINKIQIGDSASNKIMYDSFLMPLANETIEFGSIIPKDNSMSAVTTASNKIWQINDGWEIEIINPKRIAIKKFKIDTWGLRQIIPSPHTGYDNLKLKVEGLEYVHSNIIYHTSGSTVPDGFGKAYCGTNGWNVYWYPGQFTSGNYIQGLGVQFGVFYTANDNERDDSLQMGKYPWDIGNKSVITDGLTTGTWGDGNAKAITIGLYGGVQSATSWHDESNGAYKQYDISDHPIYINLDVPDYTQPIDITSIECWDVYCGNNEMKLPEIGILLSDGTHILYEDAVEDSYPNMVGVTFKNNEASFIIGLKNLSTSIFWGPLDAVDITNIKENLFINGGSSAASMDFNGRQQTEYLYTVFQDIEDSYPISAAYNSLITVNGTEYHGYLPSAGEWGQLFYSGEIVKNKINELLAKASDYTPLNYGSSIQSENNMYWTSSLNSVKETNMVQSVWGVVSYRKFGDGFCIDGVDIRNGSGFKTRPFYEYTNDFEFETKNPSLIYHKEKTLENCWKEYGFITDTWADSDGAEPTEHSYYKMNMSKIPSEIKSPILPSIVDLQPHILPPNVSDTKCVTWNHAIANNEFWEDIQKYLEEHPVIIVSSLLDDNNSQYTEEDNNDAPLHLGWFNGSKMSCTNLKIKFDGRFVYTTFQDIFNTIKVDKLTLQFLQDNISVSVLQRLFRGITASEIEVLDKNGIKSNKFLHAFDCSGMCEFATIPEIFPDIIDWSKRSGPHTTNIGYMFSYCNNMIALTQHGDTRDSDDNTIIADFIDQAFQQCTKLTSIGPILDLGRIDASKTFAPFQNCASLSDVRIKNLNGSDADFTNDGKLGVCPSFDTDSITYLINHLTDLTKYDVSIITQTVNNSWTVQTNSQYVWTTNDSVWVSSISNDNEERIRTIGTLTNIRRIAEASNTAFITINNTIDTNVNISGLQENDILIWHTDSNDTILSNGSNHLSNTGSTASLLLKRASSEINVDDNEHPVNITFAKVYSPTAPKASNGQLKCPTKWNDKITSELIATANSKNWSILINGEEVSPT